MCYELSSGRIVHTRHQFGPARTDAGLISVKDESENVQDALISVLPQLSLVATVFRPTWVRRNCLLYQCNNTYLITDSDGLDPILAVWMICWSLVVIW